MIAATQDSTRGLAGRIRSHALRMTSLGGSSHIGAVFSCADILAALYDGILRVDPARPTDPARDRLVLSKGHAGAGLYAALADRGFFPLEQLWTHYQDGSELSGHVSHKLLSDGECDEGSTWEAALFAPHHALSNLVAIVDYNRIQGIAPVAEALELEPFADKWRAFGWSVREVEGHDHAAIHAVCRALPFEAGKPSCLIARTTKGKGVSFMENTVLWHYRTPRGAEFDAALEELEGLEGSKNLEGRP